MDKKVRNDEDKIWVTITRKVNLGNYESAEIQAGYSQTIKEGEDPLELIKEAERKLSPFVKNKAIKTKKKRRFK